MTAKRSDDDTSISKLILAPFLISMAVTLLRLVGELQHWPTALFNPAAGGGGAIVGIAWLAPIFGIYFAYKLVGAGKSSSSAGKPILFAILALVVVIAGGTILFRAGGGPLALVGLALMACAAIIPAAGWSDLFKVLIAYAYSVRIPVVILMFFAMRGDWHTHYDVVPAEFTGGFWAKYLEFAVLPQLIMWIAFTTISGSLFGSIAAVFLRRGKRVPQPA